MSNTRIIAFVIAGVASAWIIVVLCISLANGLSDDSARDPFTSERIAAEVESP
jgi:hypothetical protein